MAKWTFYVDPTTGGFVIEDGALKTCNVGIACAVNAICTERGSVPDLEDFGSTIHLIGHLSESTPRQMERAADQALRPLRGLYFQDYERTAAWDVAGNPTLTVSVYNAADDEPTTETIPVSE